jgi:hypothetical protein
MQHYKCQVPATLIADDMTESERQQRLDGTKVAYFTLSSRYCPI